MNDGDVPNPAGGAMELAPGVRVDPSAVRLDYVSSSGPGGQNVNRRATKCQLRVAVDDLALSEAQRRRLEKRAGKRITQDGDLLIESDEHRSQSRNRKECYQRLRALLISAMAAPKRRKKTKPTRGSVERRIREKKERGEKKARRSRRFGDDAM